MPRRTAPKLPPAIYDAHQMCDLLGCGINELPGFVESGTIPAPLGKLQPGKKRRWSRASVHRKLRLPVDVELPDVRAIARDEVRRALRELMQAEVA